MSGGVDSAVSALLLKQKGMDVIGVHMRSWDNTDEHGVCTETSDWTSVQDICTNLNIPCMRMNLTREYWMSVFEPFVSEIAMGITPNPDIECNKWIKFGAFYKRCQHEFGDDVQLAFGHYAQTWIDAQTDKAVLARAYDESKDQTYFLSQVPQDVLRCVIFPIGHLLKSSVKEIARLHGLARVADRRESMGICMVGPRPFGSFIGEYLEHRPGDFVNLQAKVIGKHKGIAAYTIGQSAGIDGLTTRHYVVKKNIQTNQITIVPGHEHPALFSSSVQTRGWHWIAGCAPQGLLDGKSIRVEATFRSRLKPVPAYLVQRNNEIDVGFVDAQHGIALGQHIVAYDGKGRCLGGGRIQVEQQQ